MKALIETCIEGGPMTEAEVRAALAGTDKQPQVRAMLSWIEWYIAQSHQESDTRGQDARVRDEACGAANYLTRLREELMEMTRAVRPQEEEE